MIHFIPLSGFLGAGKTTTMVAARRELEAQGRRVAVITNDQGADLVDTKVAQRTGAPGGEVTGGCFCCRFEDLVEVARTLVFNDAADTIIAEAVGSCTDLQATVVRPMQRYYGSEFNLAPLTVVVDPLRYNAFSRAWDSDEQESDLSYLFRHQVGEADVIGLNKIDVVSPEEAQRTRDDLQRRFPGASIAAYSASTGQGIDRLVAAWLEPGRGKSLDVDYDRYAAAEAQLAWLNQTLDVRATEPGGQGFEPAQWAAVALNALSDACARAGYLVGHAKVAVEAPSGMTKASVTAAGQAASLDLTIPGAVRSGVVTFNARIACDPSALEVAVGAAVRAADEALGTESSHPEGRAFQPGYPEPVHRLVAEAS